jgi:hypothetical protein
MFSFDGPSLASSVIVATLGTVWFAYVLKGLRARPATTRYAIYALIWLAYFVLMNIVITKSGG